MNIISGRKLPEIYENPIDNQILYLVDYISPFLHKFGVTPNIATTFGLICRLISIYYLYTNLFLIMAVISYFFDCLDGHLARKYQQCTVFGDYYDHIGDVVYHLFLLYYLFFQSNLLISQYYCQILILLMVMALLMLIHMGCQESFHESNGGDTSNTLCLFKCFCTGPEMIQSTKYFGSGTLILLVYILVHLFAK